MPSRGDAPPSYVRGRKGGLSLVDACVMALWQQKHDGEVVWPDRSLADIRGDVSRRVGYDVPASSLRSAIYNRPDLFEHADDASDVLYRLTAKARKRAGALSQKARA